MAVISKQVNMELAKIKQKCPLYEANGQAVGIIRWQRGRSRMRPLLNIPSAQVSGFLRSECRSQSEIWFYLSHKSRT